MLITSPFGTREQRSRSLAHLFTPSPSALVSRTKPLIRDRSSNKQYKYIISLCPHKSMWSKLLFNHQHLELFSLHVIVECCIKVKLAIHPVALSIERVPDCGFYWFLLKGCAAQLPSLSAFLQWCGPCSASWPQEGAFSFILQDIYHHPSVNDYSNHCSFTSLTSELLESSGCRKRSDWTLLWSNGLVL